MKILPLGLKAGRTWERVGGECPHCHAFFHSFFNNNLLDKRREKIAKIKDYQEKIEKQVQFKRLQLRVNAEGSKLFDGS